MQAKNELLVVAREDLQFLRVEWDQSVDEASIRIASPVLRRLLVQNDLQKAWRKVGLQKSPCVKTYTLDDTFLSDQGETIEFASAGGALYKEARLVSFHVTKSEIDHIREPLAPQPPQVAIMPLNQYLKSPCMVIDGHQVPRRALIKYIANKLGGDHFDPGRDDTEEGQLHSWLDQVRLKYAYEGISFVYYELLTIGQNLVDSDDILLLSKKLEIIY